jgi:nucleotide-binding universal stress UspA family protein
MSMTERPPDWGEPVSIPEIDIGFDRILVPFDGSHTAERALGYAARLARSSGGEIIVMVAYDPPITVRRRGALTLDRLKEAMEHEAHDLAEEAVDQLAKGGLAARGLVVEGGIIDAILETTAEESVDIIIMGRRGLTHDIRSVGGRRGLGHGSVADKVARHASVPVLVVS